MSYDVAEQCVEFLVNNAKQKELLTGEKVIPSLAYFGGEPTLLWDEIIVPLTKMIRNKYGDDFFLSMTTNGTLLNKERIDFMREYGIRPHLSCDGGKEIQEANRPCRDKTKSSYEAIISNIPYILQNFPETTMRATITQNTVDQTFNSYLFAMEQGFRSFYIMPNNREEWTEENIQKLDEQVQLIFACMYSQFQQGYWPQLRFSTIDGMYEKILRRDIQYYNNDFDDLNISHSPWRCGLGTTSASFSYDGKIYGCQEQDSYSDGFFQIGDIWNGIDEKKHEALLDSYKRKTRITCKDASLCETCDLYHVCEGNCCPSSNYDINKDFFVQPIIACRWQQMIFDNAIAMMKLLVEENNQAFKEYLNIRCNYNFYFKDREEETKCE
jgi:uncharacterized protein